MTTVVTALSLTFINFMFRGFLKTIYYDTAINSNRTTWNMQISSPNQETEK